MEMKRRELLEKCAALGALTITGGAMPIVAVARAWDDAEKRKTPTPWCELGPFYKRDAPHTTMLRGANDPGMPLAVAALIWSLALAAALSLPAEFHGGDKVVVGGAVVAALWYAVVLYRRIRSGSAGVRRLETIEAAQPAATLSSAPGDAATPVADG